MMLLYVADKKKLIKYINIQVLVLQARTWKWGLTKIKEKVF